MTSATASVSCFVNEAGSRSESHRVRAGVMTLFSDGVYLGRRSANCLPKEASVVRYKVRFTAEAAA